MQLLKTRDYNTLIAPLYRFDRKFWLVLGILLLIIAPGLLLYLRQLALGLGVTDLNRPVFWGIYLVNFIFLIGVSMAGTVISAMLQLLKVEWRRPITRIAEALTVFGLMTAGLQIIMDMGRPDRIFFILRYGRLQAPLIWDVASLTLYLLTASFALYLQLLPDIALLRESIPPDAPEWRRKLYTFLSLNWRGNREQWHRLEKVNLITSILVIPIGVSLHTVTSWLFSTTVQPGWKSTILGPYFVVGAIFSGIGLLFVAATVARRYMNLEAYITEKFYKNLGWLFIVMSGIWFYFTLNETLVITAEQELLEFPVMAAKLFGAFAPTFWGMVLLMIAATWVMVAPKLIPTGIRRVPVFNPRLAWTYVVTAVLLFVFMYSMPLFPPAALLHTADTHTLLWVLILGVLLLFGFSILPWLREHPIASSTMAGIFVLVGMWLERWNILIPTLTHPRLIPYERAYLPTLTEIAITISMFGIIALLFVVFFKLFPPVSIWEMREGEAIEEQEKQA